MTPPTPTAALLACQGLTRTYPRGSEQVRALDGVTLSISAGEFLVLSGPSGSGKTTLLHLLGCMDRPSSGTVWFEGRPLPELTDREQTRLRRDRLGFVFQHFGLVPTLTVAENVALPRLFARRNVGSHVDDLLQRVGLSARRHHRPHELSGGEMQRAAIARALVNQPAVLIADEPTGNLDSETGAAIMELFRTFQSGGLTLLVATHNPAIAASAPRRIELRDGRLVGDSGAPRGPAPR